MDQAEKEHIQENLTDLVEATIISPIFLTKFQSDKVLHAGDLQAINAESTPFSKAAKLYELLPTRKGGYQVLLDALKKTNQSGAVEILEKLPKVKAAEPVGVAAGTEKVGSKDISSKMNTKLGSADFKAAGIVKRWRALDSTKLVDEWVDLARALDIPEPKIKQQRNRLKLEEDEFEITIENINAWKDSLDEAPTAGTLIKILDGLKWKIHARDVKEYVENSK